MTDLLDYIERLRNLNDFVVSIERRLTALEKEINQLNTADASTLHCLTVASSSDTAPDNDATPKKLTLQRLGSAPTNAAYIAFSNSPGSPATIFYLVLEEGEG